ncbi:sphingomyelin phosphodiesterase [Anaeramoeba flamelloides]|uniref:Sphingomyelin phosphodiesterase n=1 Tax=Anaeramoeba flamelloides TaxID=1746091 RepID=A0AAV8ADC8_9EUKA|nr:sphingomyelin phosphodiesterase [Anaeramoeba flamelloides]
MQCETNNGTAGLFGDYYCNNPFWLIEDAVREMKRLAPNPDFIIHGGDTNEQFYHDEFVIIESIKFVNELFETYFPGVPVLFTIGNHDFFPTHNSPYYNTPFLTKLSNSLTGLTDQARATFKRGGYYSTNVNNLKIISLNTIIWYKSNALTKYLKGDLSKQLSWVDSELKRAQNEGQGVLFVGHIFPGVNPFTLKPSYTNIFQDQFLERVKTWQRKYGSLILGYLYGHKHRDTFSCGPKNSIHLLNPSLNTRKRINSVFRIFNYSDTAKVLYDYTQYHNSLTETNKYKDVKWRKSYNTKKFPMNVKKLTCKYLRRWNTKLKDSNALFGWFLFHYKARYLPMIGCGASCKKRLLCAQVNLHRDKMVRCVNNNKS